MKTNTSLGFTIVELLIVIVVIAILTAVSVVAYYGIQGRTYDSAIQNDLGVLSKKIEIGYIDKGMYLTTYLTDFKAVKNAYVISPITSYNLLYCNNPPYFEKYWIVALSKSGKKFIVTSDNRTVLEYIGTWETSQATMCTSLGAPAPGVSNSRGYAADDTTSGPWRSWTGVEN